MHIVLIFGGQSPEHAISVISARTICESLKFNGYEVSLIGISKESGIMRFFYDIPSEGYIKDDAGFYCRFDTSNNLTSLKVMGSSGEVLISKKVDLCFPYIHGTTGEDGVIQGMLELLKIKYIGCNLKSSVACFDKELTKLLVKDIAQCLPFIVHRDNEELRSFDELCSTLSKENFSCQSLIIKPARQGSSIGVSKASSQEEFNLAIKKAKEFDNKIIIEPFVKCSELEISVIGSYDNPMVSKNIALIEVDPKYPLYTYEAKYKENGAKFSFLECTEDTREELRSVAKSIYQKLECKSLARIDFLMSERTRKIYLNEVNTVPGFTPISMFPMLWQKEGIDLNSLVRKLVENEMIIS